jgi:hypothetical protein
MAPTDAPIPTPSPLDRVAVGERLGDANPPAFQVKAIDFQGKPAHILLQDQNGPCPLLALANVLLLQRRIPLPRMGGGNDCILGEDLLRTLAEYVICRSEREGLPDPLLSGPSSPGARQGGRKVASPDAISQALDLLPSLYTGLPIDPAFSGPGAFEPSPELSLFQALDVRLAHGWVVDPEDGECWELLHPLTYNALVERILQAQDVMEAPVPTSMPASTPAIPATPDVVGERERLLQTGRVGRAFLGGNPTQLTYHGLVALLESLESDELCVLFR